MSDTPLWQPSDERIAAASITRFKRLLADQHGVDLSSYGDLHRFSIEWMDEFWSALWDFCGVAGEKGDRVVVDRDRMPGAAFFPDASLNFARNLLRRPDDNSVAVMSHREDGVTAQLSRRELTDRVAQTAHALRAAGVGPGDRVAAWLPNIPEACIVMLATAAIGGVYSSTSPDFGVSGVVDRFGQIEPKVLFAADGYPYAGKVHDCLERLHEIVAALPSLGTVVVIPYVGDGRWADGWTAWDDFLGPHEAGEPPYREMPFAAPLYVLYSSGTTGPPKCIVHSAGGILLQHLKEHRLHCDIRPGDVAFYFTTTGWMMWNWLVSALASEATVLLYDGAPTFPKPDSLFDLAQEAGVTLFGTSAKFIDAAHKAGLAPAKTKDLSALRTITSTGSPLVAESFDYVYRDVAADVHLASISGGTDICGCFVLGDPTRPVYRGEIQGPALGMAVDVVRADGTSAPIGEPGELVCRAPFPSMPVGFWGDPDGSKYRAAYFEAFPGLWRHGDWIARTDHGGFVIYGRSDATLNPGGVRIGTAEIYRQVEGFDEIAESIVIGQQWDGDQRVVLFVRLAGGAQLDDDLVARIRARIRSECSPRHVPAKILAVSDIPRTRSGKLVELAVRDVVHGRPVSNTEALANPEALEQFRDRPELQA